MCLLTISTMRIEKIQPSRHKAGRVLLFLEDGSLLKITEQELLDFGLRPGDVLVVFNDTRIYTTEDLQASLYSYQAGDVVQVGIYRDGTTYRVDLIISQAGKAG